jgi:hypothetical protein
MPATRSIVVLITNYAPTVHRRTPSAFELYRLPARLPEYGSDRDAGRGFGSTSILHRHLEMAQTYAR